MPFQFQPYQPDTRSIVALMQAGPAARAAALREQGQAEARAAEIHGQNAGNLANTISGSIASFMQQRAQAPILAQQAEARQIELDNAKAEQAGRQRQQQAQGIVDALPYYASGQGRDAVLSALDGPARTLAEKHYGEMDAAAANLAKVKADTESRGLSNDEARQKLATANLDYLGTLANGVKEHNYDPSAFAMAAAHGLQSGALDVQQAGQIVAHGLQHPEWIKEKTDELLAQSPQQQERARQQKAAEAAAANVAADNARADAATQETARHNGVMEKRPVGGAAAGAGSAGGLEPDAVDYTATQYRILGPSGIPTRIETADRVKILNTAARQAKALGQTPAMAVQKQAAFKADATALNKMTTMSAAAESFETKALAQADLVDKLSDKVGRTTSPLLNNWLLAGKADVAGDADAQLLFNGVTTFATEYAKIMEGSTGSVAASSDSARAAASRLVKASLNKDQLKKTVDQMRWEMRQTILGYDATIQHITERMGGAAQSSAAGPDLTGLTAGHGRTFDSGPFAGQTWTIGPDGRPTQVPK